MEAVITNRGGKGHSQYGLIFEVHIILIQLGGIDMSDLVHKGGHGQYGKMVTRVVTK